LRLFKLSSHPALTGSNFPRPEEWIFEEGERVIVSSVNFLKEARIAAIESTHLEVDFTTDEGIKAVSWYNVRKVFSPGDFVIVMSGPSRGTRGWVERIADDTVYFLEYKEEGNVAASFDDTMVSFILPMMR
jgi:transcription elongation factor